MEKPQFDRLTRAIASSGTRRTLTQGLAALPLVSPWGLLHADDATARRKRRRAQSQSDENEKKKKTVTLCLDGETIEVKKSKKKKFIKKGATVGACKNCNGGCPAGQRCCGSTCVAGTWTRQTSFGSFGTGPDQFDYPNSVAISSDGLTAWVADAQNYRVPIWTRPNGNSNVWSNAGIIGTPGTGPSNFRDPECVRVAPDDRTMWVMDTVNNRVSVWTRQSPSAAWANQTTFGSGGNGAAQFDFPSRIAVAEDGLTVWVADVGHNRISVWNRPGAGSTNWSHKGNFGDGGSNNLGRPLGVAVAKDGLTVWVSENDNGRVSVWTRPNANSFTWSYQTTISSPGSGSANLSSPRGLVASPDGLTLWISDNGNQRISTWTRPNDGSLAWVHAGNFAGPSADIAFSRDFLTAWIAEPDTNSISVWNMTCPA